MDEAFSNFVDSVGAEEAAAYLDFCEQYVLSDNKYEILNEVVIDKPQMLCDAYIAAAASIDQVGYPLGLGIIEGNTIYVGGSGYYAECEHQLVLDLAKMCVEDVVIEFWGGGPEDIAADATCGADDVVNVIHSIYSYIDCKKGKGGY